MTSYSSIATTGFLPKSRKAKKKSIYRWLRERTSSVDYGFKYNGHPIHCNTNEQVLDAFNGGKWLSRMTNDKFDDHFSGEKTHYFTGNGSPKFPETLLNIDIDCHKTGTLAGAIAFAEFLRDNFFPNLYFEVSTNGNGVHAYVVIEKGDLGAVILNELSRRLQKHLRQILSTTHFDVEDVEIKGTCPVFVWGDRKGELQNYTSGTLAKFARESHRFEELRNTTRISYLELLKLPAAEKVKPVPSGMQAVRPERPPVAGSISGKVIGPEELAELDGHYRKVAETLMEEHVLKTTGRTVATVEDLAIFLMLLRYFTKNMNRDGSLPYARFKGLWTSVFESGDVDRSFEDKRFATLRNYLSSLGLLHWLDEKYTLGTTDCDGRKHKGKASRWQASELLMSLLDWQELKKQQEQACAGGTLEEERGEGAPLAGTQLREVIRSLTRLPFSDIHRPVINENPLSWMLSPDEIAPLVMTFDDFFTLAA
jgi:hypothetical protein